jgi:hypothetical protein
MALDSCLKAVNFRHLPRGADQFESDGSIYGTKSFGFGFDLHVLFGSATDHLIWVTSDGGGNRARTVSQPIVVAVYKRVLGRTNTRYAPGPSSG